MSSFTHPIDYVLWTKTIEVNGAHQLFGYCILQNILFCVQHKKAIHAGLKQLE